jgi:hypothetical protein
MRAFFLDWVPVSQFPDVTGRIEVLRFPVTNEADY